MAKLEKAICQNPSCGATFWRQKSRKIYCSRKCFKKAYYYRMKEKELKERKYPLYHCPKCKNMVQLDFDPAKRWSPWLTFQCPLCNTLMVRVVDEVCTGDLVMA